MTLRLISTLLNNHGSKELSKQVIGTNSMVVSAQDYVNGLEYRTNGGGGTLTLEAIYHAEGRITPLSGSNYQYEYTIKDPRVLGTGTSAMPG